MLTATPITTNMVRHSLASRRFPSPKYLLMMALPPVANMVPMAVTMQITGNTIFNEERALLPIKREMKIPSTMV